MVWWIAAAAGCCVIVGVVVLAVFSRAPQHVRVESEHAYVDPRTGEVARFPSILDSATKDLTLVVPAYKETERLPIMLKETLDYLAGRKDLSWELIIVDDGSGDSTSELAQEYTRVHGTDVFRVCTLTKNRGKGGAVKQGVSFARGRRILMVDADGATKISDLAALEKALDGVERDGLGIAVGSRAHLQQDATAKRTFLRNVSMHAFHFLVSSLAVRGIQDTQCGFKLFTRAAARACFGNLHLERWAFDVELLYLATSMHVPVAEVAVNWTEIPGSKLSVLSASMQMAKDLVRIRMNYVLGLWTWSRKAWTE